MESNIAFRDDTTSWSRCYHGYHPDNRCAQIAFYLLPSKLLAECEIASRNRISSRHLATHTFAYNRHPEAPVYRRGIGDP